MPKSQTQVEKDYTSESVRVRNRLNEVALNVSRTAQIVITLDPTGIVAAELPGIGNAVRRKVPLSKDFLKRNPDLSVILHEEVSRLTALRAAQAAAPKADYIDPQLERSRRNEQIAREKAAQFERWLDSLPVERREIEIRKRDERLQKARKRELEQAHGIWLNTAVHHGVDLANHVIDDPQRRRRRKVLISIGSDGSRKEIYPQSGKQTVDGKKFDPKLVLDL